MQSALHTTALGAADWGLLFAVALPVFILTEVYKTIQFGRA